MIDNGEYFFPEPEYPKDDPRYKPRAKQPDTSYGIVGLISPLLIAAAAFYIILQVFIKNL